MKDLTPLESAGHSLSLVNREKCELTGVTDVDMFNEQMICAVTAKGAVKITGNGLHVESLNLEKGLLTVTGKVDSLSYDEARVPSGKGLMGRIFR